MILGDILLALVIPAGVIIFSRTRAPAPAQLHIGFGLVLVWLPDHKRQGYVSIQGIVGPAKAANVWPLCSIVSVDGQPLQVPTRQSFADWCESLRARAAGSRIRLMLSGLGESQTKVVEIVKGTFALKEPVSDTETVLV